jgi:hypothetical protein
MGNDEPRERGDQRPAQSTPAAITRRIPASLATRWRRVRARAVGSA